MCVVYHFRVFFFIIVLVTLDIIVLCTYGCVCYVLADVYAFTVALATLDISDCVHIDDCVMFMCACMFILLHEWLCIFISVHV